MTLEIEDDVEENSEISIENCFWIWNLKLWRRFQQYSNNTSIHGIRYLGEDKRPNWERAFWIIIFTMSICCCVKMIHSEWKKWDQTPVIVSFDDRETNVWKIPFPAITLCPETKYDPEFYKTKNFRHLLKIRNSSSYSDNESHLDRVKNLTQIHVCDHDIIMHSNNNMQTLANLSIPEILETISPITYFSCKWRNVPINCKEIMISALTDEGLCYTFNGLPPNDMYEVNRAPYLPMGQENNNFQTQWNRQRGYNNNVGIETYPKRAIGSGKHRGLEISMSLFTKNQAAKCTDLRGFKGLIHSPDNVPQLRKRFFYIPFKRRLTVAVKPNMIFTVPALRSYAPVKRQCMFEDEVKLAYFKIYTRINCEMECLLNYTINYCGCIKFYMPSASGVRICQTMADLQCCEEAENKLLENEFNFAFRADIDFENEICRCFPPCTSIEYNTETSQSKFKGTKLLFDYKNINVDAHFIAKEKTKIKLDTLNISNYGNEGYKNFSEEEFVTSVVTIMFKEDSFISSRRSELYGLSSFLSNCGGLLGLFMGVSVLSFIEILYFSIIRVASDNCHSGYAKTGQNENK